MYATLFNSAIFLAFSSGTVAAGIDFDDMFGNGNCNGVSVQGYCCPGSVLSSGDYSNNNNNDVSGLICCVGDPDASFNNGPSYTSCTTGTATPLTAVSSGAGGTASASTSASESSSAAAEQTSSSSTSSSGGDANTMSSAMVTRTTSGSDAQAQVTSSSSSTTGSSTGGAVRAMVTAAPVLAGGAMGLLALL